MKRQGISAFAFAIAFVSIHVQAETFDHSTGPHFWNVAGNWTPDSVPDAIGATAILPAPTGSLSIDLGEEIIVGELQIGEAVSPATGSVTITGANSLVISGGNAKIVNGAAATDGSSATTIGVPISIASALTVEHFNANILQFTQPISGGTGGLTINRGTLPTVDTDGVRTVVLGAANAYGGNTTLDSIGSNFFLIVRLGHADAIPSGSRIVATDSVVFELAAGNFARTLGNGASQLSFTGRSGWGAIGADRTVTLNGSASTSVNFSNITNQLVLGTSSSTHTVEFANPLVLNGATNTRIVRTFDGEGAIDAKFSGVISGPATFHKQEAGVLSLARDNTYSGVTILEGGVLRLDDPGALGDNLLQVGSGATLGIGADTAPGDPNSDFARDLGNASGNIQLISLGGGNNQANAGFVAFNGNRTVVLNSNAELVWESEFFLGGATGTHSRNLILSDETSDGTITFKNPIDLGAGNANPGLDEVLLPVTRNVVVRDGSADIDAVLPGVLQGTSSLTKDNTGTLVLSGNNIYSGGTNVLFGRLLVNNTAGSGTGSGPVTVNSTATLGGTGSVAGTVTVNSGGHIAPGASIESLQLGGLTIETGSILDFELGTPNGTAGVNNDLLNVLGATTLNGVGTVSLTDAGGLGVGSYTLIDYAGALAGSDIAGFLGQTPTGPAGFSYALTDTGSTIDLTVGVAPTNDADFNDDGVIDAGDYVVWRKFNPTAAPDGTQGTGDADGDGDVDQTDYDEWFENFETPSAGGSESNSGGVPEPTTLVLISMAAMFVLQRRGRWIRK